MSFMVQHSKCISDEIMFHRIPGNPPFDSAFFFGKCSCSVSHDKVKREPCKVARCGISSLLPCEELYVGYKLGNTII